MTPCDETIDDLRGFDLRIIQPRDGYRFSLDPLLLCDFAGVKSGDRVIDLGTGCAIIPLILARTVDEARIVGVEHQPVMAGLAVRNVVANGLDSRISVIQADVTELRGQFPVSSFDLVVANPPYRVRGTGRVSPKAGRDLARHESTAGLGDFLAAAKYLVRPGGRICFIYHPSRLPELFTEAAALKLAPLRLRTVHGSLGTEARMVLLELAKGSRGVLTVMPPLQVRDAEGNDGMEMERLLRG
jgi:tRNA1Val (adenine37-N6)-methyltransferase